MSAQEASDRLARLGKYDEEIENGILNLVVSLVKQKEARGLAISIAKQEVAAYLDQLANGLRSLEE